MVTIMFKLGDTVKVVKPELTLPLGAEYRVRYVGADGMIGITHPSGQWYADRFVLAK